MTSTASTSSSCASARRLKIYVISLKERRDRREFVEATLFPAARRLGVDVQFVDAVDAIASTSGRGPEEEHPCPSTCFCNDHGHAYGYRQDDIEAPVYLYPALRGECAASLEAVRRRWRAQGLKPTPELEQYYGRDTSRAEISCFLSHLKTWRLCNRRDLDHSTGGLQDAGIGVGRATPGSHNDDNKPKRRRLSGTNSKDECPSSSSEEKILHLILEDDAVPVLWNAVLYERSDCVIDQWTRTLKMILGHSVMQEFTTPRSSSSSASSSVGASRPGEHCFSTAKRKTSACDFLYLGRNELAEQVATDAAGADRHGDDICEPVFSSCLHAYLVTTQGAAKLVRATEAMLSEVASSRAAEERRGKCCEAGPPRPGIMAVDDWVPALLSRPRPRHPRPRVEALALMASGAAGGEQEAPGSPRIKALAFRESQIVQLCEVRPDLPVARSSIDVVDVGAAASGWRHAPGQLVGPATRTQKIKQLSSRDEVEVQHQRLPRRSRREHFLEPVLVVEMSKSSKLRIAEDNRAELEEVPDRDGSRIATSVDYDEVDAIQELLETNNSTVFDVHDPSSDTTDKMTLLEFRQRYCEEENAVDRPDESITILERRNKTQDEEDGRTSTPPTRPTTPIPTTWDHDAAGVEYQRTNQKIKALSGTGSGRPPFLWDGNPHRFFFRTEAGRLMWRSSLPLRQGSELDLLGDAVAKASRNPVAHPASTSSLPDYRWLVMAPAGAGFSWHCDPYHSSAWNVLLSGGPKHWLFSRTCPLVHALERAPAGQDEDLNRNCRSTLENIEVKDGNGARAARSCSTKTKRTSEVALTSAVQRPGEGIFIPAGWWHTTWSETVSLAFTQNYCFPDEIREATRELRQLRFPKVADAMCKIHLDRRGEDD